MKRKHTSLKKDFPLFKRHKQLAYLDNAATTQKPQSVIDAMDRFYSEQNANVHRGLYKLSQTATDLFEGARTSVARFINAPSEKTIIFVRGATEGLNLIAQTFGRLRLGKDDEIILSEMEHHANIVPWQMLCEQTGAKIKVIPVLPTGELDLEAYKNLLNAKTKLVSLIHVSNTLGTVNPIKEIVKTAHEHNVPVIVDGAQAVAHDHIDVQDLDCDFYVFSGHKMYGPTGIGVVYGKEEHLNAMPPYQGGGDMIASVTFQKTLYKQAPHKFEAGTPAIAEAIGLQAAIDYLQGVGSEIIQATEQELLTYATDQLQSIPGLTIIGTAPKKAPIISFTLEGIHPHDLGTLLDEENIAIRAGHHCTQPLMERFNVPATARISLSFYNDKKDIDRLVKTLHKARALFATYEPA